MHLYTHLAIAQVHAFLRHAPEVLEPERASAVRDSLEAAVRATDEWRQRLVGLRRERLARELRVAIRSKRLREAGRCINEMAAMAGESVEGRSALVGYLASTMGTLDHDQDKVDSLIGSIDSSPAKYGLSGAEVGDLREARNRQFAALQGMALEGREREFTRVITQAIVDLRNKLTLEMAVGEPTEEETAKLFHELHGIFRAVAMTGSAEFLIDATQILVEITPRDPRAVGPAVEGEERLFLNLNPRQKLCCVRALRRIGDVGRIRNLYLKFAESANAKAYLISVVEIMGGLGCKEFSSFVLKIYRDRSVADPRFSCVDALGRLEDEAATAVLSGRISSLLRARPFDPPKRREAEAILSALGRIARNPSVSPARRGEIVSSVIDDIPESDSQMGFCAVRDFFSLATDTLDIGLIDWAMSRIVFAMWGQDQRPEFARGGEGQEADLGFRHEMVGLATRMGERGLQPFLNAVQPYAGKYSGAFYAVAEVLERVGNETALPLLQTMTLNALMADDNQGSKYFKETYFDPADQQLKPLGRDKVVHALLHATVAKGGEMGVGHVVDLARQARAKQLEVPGDQTASYLMQILMEHGSEVDARASLAEEDPNSISATVAAAADNPLAGAHIDEVIDALKPRLLMGKARRSKRIQAIQEIARRRSVDGIEPLVAIVGDKDSIINSAAATALLNFGGPGAKESTLRFLGAALIDRLGKAKSENRSAVRNLLLRLDPAREPFSSMLEQEFEMKPEGALKAELSNILRQSAADAKRKEGDPLSTEEILVASNGREGPDDEAGDETTPEPSGIDGLDARRQYFMARKAWLSGGKKGPEPKPPA